MISRLFPAVALIIAVAIFLGYINPTRSGSITETKAQINSYNNALEAAERFEEKQGELIIARANIPSDGLASLATFLPDGVDNVQIILDLNTLAARSGITLSDFDTADTVTPAQTDLNSDPTLLDAEGPIESLDITVSATGTYASFRTFLEGIEESLRLLDVVAVKVDDSETGVYTYDMTIRLYWLR